MIALETTDETETSASNIFDREREKEGRRERGREDAISRKECNIKAFSLLNVFSHPGALL